MMRLIKTQEALDAGRTHTQTRESQAAGAEAGMREAAAAAAAAAALIVSRLRSFARLALTCKRMGKTDFPRQTGSSSMDGTLDPASLASLAILAFPC